jgi:hypothetical protein
LADRKPAVAPGSTVLGDMAVIDSEKLHIGDIDVRLFGVVPPQLSASFGPQARATLDKLVTGQPVSCLVRDRDQAGRFLATCRTAGNADLAMELLRRGLAVTARGSLTSTDLAQPYMAAEQAAQTQKIGLWSGVTPAPVAVPAPVAAPVVAPQPAPQSQATVVPPPAPPTAPVVDTKKEAAMAKADEAKMTPAPLAASSLEPPSDETLAVPDAPDSFFARYQILITGLIMLVTALSILGVISSQRRHEKRDEMKAIAAALRGELTAARGVCLARLKSVVNEGEDKAMTWPRLRSTLYQAYIGRLGWLGADLARQIASIYGQASDYAAYYSSDDETKVETTPKRQALQTLVQHIEEVLPRLMHIEQTGRKAYYSASHSVKASAPLIEKSITVSAPEKTAASEVTQHVPLASHPIWDTMRKFARERFTEDRHQTPSDEQDYAALIEEEMANLTFGEAEDEHPTNVTKIRPTGS